MKHLLLLSLLILGCTKTEHKLISCGMAITTHDNYILFTDPCIEYGNYVDFYAYDQLVPPLTFYEGNKIDSIVPSQLLQTGYMITVQPPTAQWHFYLKVYQLNSPEFDIIGPFTN